MSVLSLYPIIFLSFAFSSPMQYVKLSFVNVKQNNICLIKMRTLLWTAFLQCIVFFSRGSL